ncbi:MAG: hypothetical protein ACYTBJ_23800 [Planctomycetota bacterium]|jgi:hypothetical protein
MSTYQNAREILKSVRYGLNEYSSGKLDGTDVSGKFQNEYLMRKINEAQRYIYAKVFKRVPEIFLESVSLTGVNSVFTLPANFSVLKLFRDENGDKVLPIELDALKRTDSTGSARQYYRKGNTLVLDKDAVTETYTLWYLKKCRELTTGKASAGAATSMTLATTASKLVDYYNGMTFENETQDWVDTVDDYATTRVATISETAAANDYYGNVSELPEEFHDFIATRAVMLVNVEFPPNVKAVTSAQKVLWDDEFVAALQSYCGAPKDVPIEEIITDFSPATPTFGGIDTSE